MAYYDPIKYTTTPKAQSNLSLANNAIANTAAGAKLGGNPGSPASLNIFGYSTANRPTALDSQQAWTYDPTTGYSLPGKKSTDISNTTNNDTTNTTANNPGVVNGVGIPDYDPAPTIMDWDTAFARAKSQEDPTYNSLRSKLEQTYSDQREQTPQLMAARGYGMGRGGMYQSAMAGVTQKEAAAIDDIESQRQQAISSMADQIRNGEYDSAFQKWQVQQQLKQQQYSNEYQQYRDSILDAATKNTNEDNNYWKYLYYNRDLTNDERSQSNADRSFGLTEQQYLNSPEAQPWYLDYYKTGQDLDNAIKQRTINTPYGRSGVGSSGSDTKNYQWAQNQALDMAKADPRLAGQTYTGTDELGNKYTYTKEADGVNYFSLNQLMDAYMRQIAYNQYGGQ